MKPPNLEEKRIFLVASASSERAQVYAAIIQAHIAASTVFTSGNGQDVLFKLDNAPPHVLIVDINLPKVSGLELTEKILRNTRYSDMAIIIVSELPDQEHFVDEVVLGKVQFLTDYTSEAKFNFSLARALNYLSQGGNSEYTLKFLTPNEVLFKEGERGDCAYIVRRGQLRAVKGISGDNSIVVGTINTGEFVGEMAHINGEPRSATVQAISDSELIEIPFGTLDSVLFSKPAWSKALVLTLSKRLKKTSIALTEND